MKNLYIWFLDYEMDYTNLIFEALEPGKVCSITIIFVDKLYNNNKINKTKNYATMSPTS